MSHKPSKKKSSDRSKLALSRLEQMAIDAKAKLEAEQIRNAKAEDETTWTRAQFSRDGIYGPKKREP